MPPAPNVAPLDHITRLAEESEVARLRWTDRGRAPLAYTRGMALVYGRVYCKLKAGDAAVVAMAVARTSDAGRDVLAWYAHVFAGAGLSNDTDGADTLRHLFVLLFGLGMRESSGKHCSGRDASASNTSAETSEAGLFQTSFNARTAHPLLGQVLAHYTAHPSGFIEVFRDGVTCRAADATNHGTGAGKEFQRLSKECPAFAAEFAALCLRHRRRHYGPINRREAEVRVEVDRLLLQVQAAVDAHALCPALLA